MQTFGDLAEVKPVEQEGQDLHFTGRDVKAGGRAGQRAARLAPFDANSDEQSGCATHGPRSNDKERHRSRNAGLLRRRIIRPRRRQLTDGFLQNERQAVLHRHLQSSQRDAALVLVVPSQNDLKVAIENVQCGRAFGAGPFFRFARIALKTKSGQTLVLRFHETQLRETVRGRIERERERSNFARGERPQLVGSQQREYAESCPVIGEEQSETAAVRPEIRRRSDAWAACNALALQNKLFL